MTKALEMINICIYSVREKGQWETGHFKMFQERKDTFLSGKRDIGNGTHYTLGFGPLILWESGI